MAAPADRTIKDFSGEWVMDKTLSDPTDPVLILQGLSWLTRKAIGLATVTLHINEYPDAENDKVIHIDIEQIGTGGLRSTEKRITDWTDREHRDNIFGTVLGKSRMLRGSKGEDGKVRPEVDVNTRIGGNGVDDATAKRFLRGEILADGTESEGFVVDNEGDEFGEGEGLWLQSFVVNQDAGYGWTAEQIWGFELIDGQRYHTRRVVVAKDGNFEMARLVYGFMKRREE